MMRDNLTTVNSHTTNGFHVKPGKLRKRLNGCNKPSPQFPRIKIMVFDLVNESTLNRFKVFQGTL